MMPASPVRARCSHLLLTLGLAGACGEDPPAPVSVPVAAPVVEEVAPEPAPVSPSTRRVAYHPDDLRGDLGAVTELDLAFSPTDRLERRAAVDDERSYADVCAGLDLTALASRAPQVRSLRVSGCQTAVHVGLGAFTGVESLELVDLVLDGVAMGRVTSLPRLRALTLTRMRAGSEPVAVLGRLALESLTLRELDHDSPLAAVAGQAPQLQRIALEGPWAGHEAMLALGKADKLREVRLVDTRVGNFSLHQLKPLTELRTIFWQGTTFNDHSPLYVRDLAISSFTCACPGLGDAGLKVLGRQLGLTELVLPQSRISGAGLALLAKLERLARVHLGRRDPGTEGITALVKLPALVDLAIDLPAPATLADPTLTPLGELVTLKKLRLDIPTLDDRAAPQLATLVALEQLDLGGTQISDVGLKALAGLTQLTELRLHHTRVTNRGLVNLAGLTRLQVLELDHTDLVDDGVAHLAGLRQLRVLRLDKTLITDVALSHLIGMDRLEQLNLADTVVTADGVAVLRRLPALRAVGYTRDTPDPPGGRIERDKAGNPTGLLLAKPNALILYATLSKGPRLPPEYQLNSTRHYMRELNRLGITSVIDAGGGFQNWPDDYAVIRKLHANGELTVRIAYNLFTQNNGGERADFERWSEMLQPRDGDDWFRHNGAGEMLVFSAADFELFSQPRPELPEGLEPSLEQVVRHLSEHRWPFRIHATYDETIERFLVKSNSVTEIELP